MNLNSTERPTTQAAKSGLFGMSPKATMYLVGALVILSADSETFAILPLLRELSLEYGLSPTQVAWMAALPGLTAAGLVPVMCRLGDMFGVRRLLIISIAAAAAGNVICLLSPGPTGFLVGRAIIGGGVACIPLLYSYLRLQAETQEEINESAGFMTAIIGGGLVVSFLMGGVIMEVGGSVRTAMLAITILSLVVVVLLRFALPDNPTRVKCTIDYVGSVILAVALTALVLGLAEGNKWGWTSSKIIACLVSGTALLAIWVVWERRTAAPIIDLSVIMRREVWPAFVVCAMTTFMGVATVLTATQYLQTPEKAGYGFGMTPFQVGLSLLPVGFMMAFGGLVVGSVVERIGVRPTAALGGLLSILNFGWFSVTDAAVWKYLVMLFLFGTAYALTVTAGASAYLRAARPGETGMVTGAARIVATALGSLGPAIAAALLTSSYIPKTSIPNAANYDKVWMFFAACGVLVIVVSQLIRQSDVRNDLAPNTVQNQTA
ncbi:MFS transporter [Rhodococcus sp. 24CO]|uniref:MFS transporter n=1 Tax=Rhodococcus sp. 24CO TaxID=3117460 RepID=UPI003D32A978